MYVFLLKPASPNILIKKEISIQLWKGVGWCACIHPILPRGCNFAGVIYTFCQTKPEDIIIRYIGFLDPAIWRRDDSKIGKISFFRETLPQTIFS
jgi:hypothetical protein